MKTAIKLLCVCVALNLAYWLGLEHSRQQIRDVANSLADSPLTNSFAKCLTESWELTGELDPSWKGGKAWHLGAAE